MCKKVKRYLGLCLSVNHRVLLEKLGAKTGYSDDIIIEKALEAYASSCGITLTYTTDLSEFKLKLRDYLNKCKGTEDESLFLFRINSLREQKGVALKKTLDMFISEMYDIKVNRVSKIYEDLSTNANTLAKVVLNEFDNMTEPDNLIRLEIYHD